MAVGRTWLCPLGIDWIIGVFCCCEWQIARDKLLSSPHTKDVIREEKRTASTISYFPNISFSSSWVRFHLLAALDSWGWGLVGVILCLCWRLCTTGFCTSTVAELWSCLIKTNYFTRNWVLSFCFMTQTSYHASTNLLNHLTVAQLINHQNQLGLDS